MNFSHRPYIRTLKEQLEFDAFIAELRARTPKRPATTEQAPSTARTLAMSDEELQAYRSRDLPSNWLAVPDAKNVDEAVNARSVTVDEVVLIDGMRKRGHDNTVGQSTLSATTEEKRASAIDAVIYTPPAKVTPKEVEQRAINLTSYESQPLKEIWVELSWWKALWHWIKGNEVKSGFK